MPIKNPGWKSGTTQPGAALRDPEGHKTRQAVGLQQDGRACAQNPGSAAIAAIANNHTCDGAFDLIADVVDAML